MVDFLLAALPWVLMGVAVILFARHHAKSKRRTGNDAETEQPGDEKKSGENRMAEGMSLGMCFGVAISSSGVCDLAIGISMGMLLGMLVGMNIKK